MILCLAGICLGTLAKVSDETFGALGYTYTVIAVCKYAMQTDMGCVLDPWKSGRKSHIGHCSTL